MRLSATYADVSFRAPEAIATDENMEKNFDSPASGPACAPLERLGNRWTLLVLHTLREQGTLRFHQLVREVPGGISERMLAATLRDLEQAGMVRRTLYPEVPPRTEYALAPKTLELLPILDRLIDWAERTR